MSWTDERTETMKKLWGDGLSASQIAKQLGGVTRNAVIGKLHRLGLTGRAQPARPARAVASATRARVAARPRSERPKPVLPPVQPSPVRFRDEAPGSATVLTLGRHMCKWPIGDPSSDTFTFCGRRNDRGSYCAEHARVAFQPPAGKRDLAHIERLAHGGRR